MDASQDRFRPHFVTLGPRDVATEDHNLGALVRPSITSEMERLICATCRPFEPIAAPTSSQPSGHETKMILAALATSLCTVGLVRFAYTPLLPPLIRTGLFPESELVALSSAGLLGFLLGALAGRSAARHWGAPTILNCMNVLASLSLLCCAFPISVTWLFLWRVIGGISGGGVIVLLGATVLPHVSPSKRGVVGGAIFVGFGIGILASGSLVPLLLHFGLRTAWLGLGTLTSLLTVLVWRWWPRPDPDTAGSTARLGNHLPPHRRQVTFFALFAFLSIGLASPMIFYSTFISRQLGAASAASWGWLLYGLGATAGPVLLGWASSSLGGAFTMRTMLTFEALVTGSLLIVARPLQAAGLALFLGLFVTGVVPLAQGWLRELYPGDPDAQNRTWSFTATLFAASQALAGYLFSFLLHLYARNYRVVFGVSAAALIVALGIASVGFRGTQKQVVATGAA